MDDIVNCFRGVAYSTSSMKGEDLSTSSTYRFCGSGRRLWCLGRRQLTSSSASKG
ncbi:unnamed protein product [Prunus brigantina]